jgi:hypothetical protein
MFMVMVIMVTVALLSVTLLQSSAWLRCWETDRWVMANMFVIRSSDGTEKMFLEVTHPRYSVWHKTKSAKSWMRDDSGYLIGDAISAAPKFERASIKVVLLDSNANGRLAQSNRAGLAILFSAEAVGSDTMPLESIRNVLSAIAREGGSRNVLNDQDTLIYDILSNFWTCDRDMSVTVDRVDEDHEHLFVWINISESS